MALISNEQNGLLNADSLAEAKRGKIVYLSIYEIRPNAKNIPSIEAIEEMADSIEEGGLLQPLLVMKQGEEYILHTGHRRLAALKLLREQKRNASFMGKELDDTAPCIYIPEMDDLNERISMLRSNSYRHDDKETRRKKIIEAHNCYKKLEKAGLKPKGREREWITSTTGISDGTVKTILTSINEQEEILNKNSENAEFMIEDKPKDYVQECLKKLKGLNKYLSKIDVNDYPRHKRLEINEEIDDLIDTLQNHIYLKN